MAGIASRRSGNMVGRFAGDGYAVAGGAGARFDLSMTESCASPGRGRAMAHGATLICRHVVGGLGGVAETAALGMARFASVGRALEDAAHVTGLTLLLRVRASEREASALMIKAAAPFRSLDWRGEREQDQDQADECG